MNIKNSLNKVKATHLLIKIYRGTVIQNSQIYIKKNNKINLQKINSTGNKYKTLKI
jgi:hypothetical protein